MHSAVEENAKQTARLEELLSRDIDLSADAGGGWTVAVVLAHMAFWDRRATGLLKLWDEEGRLPDAVNDDLLNEVLLPEWLAMDPRAAGALALDAAKKVDEAVQALPSDKAEAIEMMGNGFMLTRGDHRREHIDQIEQALG